MRRMASSTGDDVGERLRAIVLDTSKRRYGVKLREGAVDD